MSIFDVSLLFSFKRHIFFLAMLEQNRYCYFILLQMLQSGAITFRLKAQLYQIIRNVAYNYVLNLIKCQDMYASVGHIVEKKHLLVWHIRQFRAISKQIKLWHCSPRENKWMYMPCQNQTVIFNGSWSFQNATSQSEVHFYIIALFFRTSL